MTKIYQLVFDGYVRFGNSSGAIGVVSADFIMRSDAFFSAVCTEWLKIFGEDSLSEMISAAANGELLFSDLLPFSGDSFYIHKPVFTRKYENVSNENQGDDKKRYKNARFIEVGSINEYLKNGKVLSEQELDQSFVIEEVVWKNSIDQNHEATPFAVSTYRFIKDSGLYFIAQLDEKWEEQLCLVVDSLATTGLGGKRSIGYGKFQLYDDPLTVYETDPPYYSIDRALKRSLQSADHYYLLSSLLPADEDIKTLKESHYSLLRRGGFIDSPSYHINALKKNQIAMVASGSVLSKRVTGRMADVSNSGAHPVYRNGFGMYIGVNIDG